MRVEITFLESATKRWKDMSSGLPLSGERGPSNEYVKQILTLTAVEVRWMCRVPHL